MGIKGATLGMALAASMGACETTEDNKKEETQYGQSTQALNIHDPEHFGQPFTPDRSLETSHDRNRSSVVIDGLREEFEFFVSDGQAYVQRCDLGPDQCSDPVAVPILSFGQIGGAFSVAVPNGDGTYENRIYNSSNFGVESNALTIGPDGMPTSNPDDIDAYRAEDMRGNIAPATMEIDGQAVEGILWNGANGELNFHNPITRENTLLAENVAGLNFCGVSSRGLEYDFRRNDNSVNGCRIVIRAEAAVATGLVGSDARSVEIGQLDGSVRRFIYFTDVNGTSKVVEINPYDGDGVCAPGEIEDCAVVPADMGVPVEDAGVPVDMNVPPVDMGVPVEDAGVPVDMNVPPADMGVPPVDMNVPPADMNVPPADMNVPPADAGMGGAGGEGGAGGQGGAGGEGGMVEPEGCENDDDCVEGEECNFETKECVEVTLEDFIAKVPANSDCKISNAVDNGDGTMSFSVISEKNGVTCENITVQLRDIPANPVLMTVSSQADSPAGLDCEVTPGFGEDSDLAMVCDNTFGSAAKVKKNGEDVTLNSSNGEVAFTATGSELEMSEYDAPLNSEGLLVEEGTTGAILSPVIQLTAIQHDATAKIRGTLQIPVPEGRTLILDPTGLEIQIDDPDVPTPPDEEPGVGIEGGGCGCKTTNGGNVPAWMVALFGGAVLTRRRKK